MTTEIARSASTGAPAEFPVAQDFPYAGYITSGVAVAMTVISAILLIRRRISKDNTEIKKDSTERDLLHRMMQERDRAQAAAEEAWRNRAEDAKLIGQLTGEVKHLTEANQNLIQDVDALRRDIKDLHDTLTMLMPSMAGLSISPTELRDFVAQQRAAQTNEGDQNA